MKRHILILFLISIVGVAKAQDSSKVRVGFKIGWSEVYTDRSSTQAEMNPASMRSLSAFSGALLVDIPLYKSLSLQPAIEYGVKGQSRKYYNATSAMEYKIKYWTLPLNLVYKYKGFYVGAGPYGAYAVNGKFKQGGSSRDVNIGENYFSASSKNNDDWSVYDIGVNGILGYKLWKFTIGVRYDLGLRDIDPNPYYSSKTRRAGIEIGMLF